MRIELGKNYIVVVPEDYDDYYVLYLIIDKGDLIYGWTLREFRTRKRERGERRRIYVGLKVESVEYHAFRDSLRVRGVIIEAPEQFDGIMGSYHTIEIIRGLRYRIVKDEKVSQQMISAILDLFGRSSPRALVLSISDEEAAIAMVRKFGVDVLTTIHNKYLVGKSHCEEDMSAQVNRFVREVCSYVKIVLQREHVNTVIVAGPSYVIDRVKGEIESELRGVSTNVVLANTFEGGLAGVYELQSSKNDVLKYVIGMSIAAYIDEVYSRLGQGRSSVAIGLHEVKRSVELGAAECILVLDEVFKDLGEDMKHLARKAVDTNAKLVIVPSHTNAGERLRGLTGIVALLRYEIE